jgi:hypothetical protein
MTDPSGPQYQNRVPGGPLPDAGGYVRGPVPPGPAAPPGGYGGTTGWAQPPPMWSPPPAQRRNAPKTGLVVALIAVMAVIVVTVGVVAVVFVARDRGGASVTADASQGGGAPADDKVAPLMSALQGAGYFCSKAMTKPTAVHSCYLDPSGLLRTETVVIHSDAGGAVANIHLTLNNDKDPSAVSALFDKTVKALTPAPLTAAEADDLIQAKNKGRGSRGTIGWGSVELAVIGKGRGYSLKLMAPGVTRIRPIPHGNTRVQLPAIRDRFTAKGFSCSVDSQLKSMKCARRETNMAYDVLAVDPCIENEATFDPICKDAGVYSVQASVGFANGLPEQAYAPVATFLLETTEFALGGWEAATQQWVSARMGDAEVHRADLQGVHIELTPGAGAAGGFPQVFSITVSGINFPSP